MKDKERNPDTLVKIFHPDPYKVPYYYKMRKYGEKPDLKFHKTLVCDEEQGSLHF